MKKHFFPFLFFILVVVPCFAQSDDEEPTGGPPTTDELIGFWKLQELPPDMNKVNPWPLPYQWFGFYENGKLYTMMNTEDEDYSVEDLKEIFSALPEEKTPNFVHQGQFLTVDQPEMQDYLELWGVNIFYKDVGKFAKKGDLIMSLDDGNGEVIYYRLLRKIE
ncbi:MAG: hypothetical protein JJ966_04500 [Balneolaceae bacterium]|nr:hypothetical protein [Balneolaceae bacterium]